MAAGGMIYNLCETDISFAPFDISWIPSSARLAVCGSDTGAGVIEVLSLVGKDLTHTCKITAPKPFRCGTFNSSSLSDRIYCTGDFSGYVTTWDLETESTVESVRGHSDLVNCIAGRRGQSSGHEEQGDGLLVTGGRDGEVRVWDRRCMEKPAVTMTPEEGRPHRDCWSVAVHPDRPDDTIGAGFDNGDVKLFDTRNLSVSWEMHFAHCRGVSSLELGPDRQITLGTGMGKLYCVTRGEKTNAGNEIVLKQLEKSTVWRLESFPVENRRDTFFASLGTGSLVVGERVRDSEGNACEGIEVRAIEQLADAPVIAVGLHADKPGLAATASFDQKVRVHIYNSISES